MQRWYIFYLVESNNNGNKLIAIIKLQLNKYKIKYH